MIDFVVAALALYGALCAGVLVGFTPLILAGWWHDRHPRPPATTPMPDRYRRLLDERDVALWEKQAVAEAETVAREAAP